MALRDIIILPDKRLRTVSKPVDKITAEIRTLVEDMFETMYDAPGIGLAAIQVAVPLRVVTMDIAKKEDEHEPRVFINPEIVSRSDERSVYEEGCLSIPEIHEDVERPAKVRVKYLDLDGKPHEEDAEGLLRDLHPARDRSPQRRAVHRLHFQAQARPHRQEIHQGGETRGRGRQERVVSRTVPAKWMPVRRQGHAPLLEQVAGCSRSSPLQGHVMPLRLVFMGTPDFAVPTLVEIVGRGHDVAAVYTRAPRPAGRGMELHALAGRARRARLRHPGADAEDAAGPTRRRMRSAPIGADAAVVVAYGLILPKPILDAPPLGCFNLHASVLPRWRGAAPINRAIMAGDAETAVMVMKMEEGLDTGPVAMAERVAIAPDMTAGELHDTPRPARRRPDGARARRAGEGRADADAAAERGRHLRRPRSTRARPASTGRKPWRAVHDHIRGLSPFPGAWFEMGGAGVRVKVLRTTRGDGAGAPGTVLDDKLTIACGEGAVRILELQRAGKQPMTADDSCAGPRSRRAPCWLNPARCPATSSPSNMTARRSSAGRSRTTAPRCRAR